MIRRGFLAVVASLACAWVAASCLSQSSTCTPADAVMAAHGAECSARVHACAGEPKCRAAVIAECDAWGAARCAIADDAGANAGAAGAP